MLSRAGRGKRKTADLSFSHQSGEEAVCGNGSDTGPFVHVVHSILLNNMKALADSQAVREVVERG